MVFEKIYGYNTTPFGSELKADEEGGFHFLYRAL